MPTGGISKLKYDIWCLQMALNISTFNSDNSYLH